MTTELKWGETPFDRLSREEMRTLLCRFYSALNSTRGVLHAAELLQMQAEAKSPYWGPDGLGGRALAKAHQALNPVHAEFGGEEAVWRAFFRVADDLLFDSSKYRIGSNWAVCPKCGVMIGGTPDGISPAGTACAGTRRSGGCSGTLRKIEWSDLEPKREAP